MENGAEKKQDRLPDTGWVAKPEIHSMLQAEYERLRADQAQAMREIGGPVAFLKDRAPGALTLFSGPWTPELVQAETTAAWQDASRRVAQCAKCPAHGGACAGDVSVLGVGTLARYDGARGLVSDPCPKWARFEDRERALRARIPAALVEWPLHRLLTGDGEYGVRAGLVSWMSDVARGERAPSLLITGRRPHDRTRLAAGIALEMLRAGVRASYTFAPRLATEMRDYFKSARTDEPGVVTSPMEQAESAKLLVFDFVDPKPKSREPWADWFVERVDMMLWRRLSAERPTVLVSRLRATDLMTHFPYTASFSVLECDMDLEGFGPVSED